MGSIAGERELLIEAVTMLREAIHSLRGRHAHCE